MKKHGVIVLAVAVALVALAKPLFAQHAELMKINVPFNFVAENQRMQAGAYTIQPILNGGLLIRSADGKIVTTVLSLPAPLETTATVTQVVFHRYGDHYFLAQLWNVLKGDMSLIGPRPERPEFVEWLKQEIPYYHLRHTVRPGITGWAQIRYKYGSSLEDAKEKLRYDLFYIKNMSPGLDALIFFDTVKTILLGRGAK